MLGHSQALGDFIIGLSLVSAHCEYFTALRRHLPHHEADQKFLFLAIIFLLDVRIVQNGQFRYFDHNPLATEVVERGISGHPINIGIDGLDFRKRISHRPYLDDYILCDILSRLVIFQKIDKKHLHFREKHIKQSPEGFVISPRYAFQKACSVCQHTHKFTSAKIGDFVNIPKRGCAYSDR